MDVDMTFIASITVFAHHLWLTYVIRVRSWWQKIVSTQPPVSTRLWADVAVEFLYMAADAITVHTRTGTSSVDD